jgi:mannose-6-phosphate isomerase
MKDISLARLSGPIRLQPIFRERVWGRNSLLPYFPEDNANRCIGEVWFTFEENVTDLGKTLGDLLRLHPEILGTGGDSKHPGVCPLLVKLLFTTERLSVQVHPDDKYAALHHQSLGKTEAWYVMDSQPPGEVAVGFREAITAQKLKEAALSGEIETLLDWRKVSPGDVVFTPAGTVHAIGAGVTICEIQENSDITYRLYDYGRPRELHLEHGMAVSDVGVHTYQAERKLLGPGREELLACDYFRIERLRPAGPFRIGTEEYYLLLICIAGAGKIGDEVCKAGEAFLIPARGAEVILYAPGSEWIVTYTAAEAARFRLGFSGDESTS